VAALLLVLVLVGCAVFLPEPAGDVVVAVVDVSGGASGGDEAFAGGPVPDGDGVPGVYAGQRGDEDSGVGGSVLARPDRASTEWPPSEPPEPVESPGARARQPLANPSTEPPRRHADRSAPAPDPVARAAVRRGITRVEILLGLITLGTALGEGAANDWLAVALVDGRGAPAAIGALTYAGFNLTMALGRFTGGPLIARFGRVASLRTAGVIAATGVLLLCLVPSTAMAFVGAAAWGLGLAIVFPSAMSAAGEVPGRGGRAIATVSTIGYGGFLLGAPTIGLLAHAMPLLHALLVVAAFAILIVVLAPAARERGRSG